MSEVEKILQSREQEYGDALENFEMIGKIWGALLQIDPIPPYQIALMMDALKTVRLFANYDHEDSWLDKEGYTKLGHRIVTQ
jgi:hypothetical protein